MKITLENGKLEMFDAVQELRYLLDTDSKHENYQLLPPFLPKEFLQSLGKVKRTRLDRERFAWFTLNYDFKDCSVIEIGANAGYFSTRLANEYNSKVIAYEPYANHANAIKLIAKLGNIGEDRIDVIQEQVNINNIKNLPKVDIILFLNVLHHAGYDFDKKYVKSINDWEVYAVNYLRNLGGKSRKMVFQIGYTLGGIAENLCKEGDIFDFTVNMLRKSGWEPFVCGALSKVPKNKREAMYINVDINRYHTVLKCKKSLIYKAISRIGNEVRRIVELPNASEITSCRFAQRPLFLCKFGDSSE